MDDSQIIELYCSRDEAAIEATSSKYGAYCHTVAYNVLHNNEDSEECVNDTWLKAWNSIPPARPGYLNMFLAKITRNLAFNTYEKKHAAKRGGGETDIVLNELAECIPDRLNVESEVLVKELEGIINSYVSSLPKKEAYIFIRRYFFTEPVPDIADRYRLTPGNVNVILSRTRNKLRQYLEKEDYHI